MRKNFLDSNNISHIWEIRLFFPKKTILRKRGKVGPKNKGLERGGTPVVLHLTRLSSLFTGANDFLFRLNFSLNRLPAVVKNTKKRMSAILGLKLIRFRLGLRLTLGMKNASETLQAVIIWSVMSCLTFK